MSRSSSGRVGGPESREPRRREGGRRGFGSFISSSLSSSLTAGPVGKLETRFLRFQLSHRAVLVSFFFAPLFSFFANNRWFRRLFHRPRESGADPRRNPIGCAAWGCGSWGPRSLVDRSIAKCRPRVSFLSSKASAGMVLCGPQRLQVALPVDMTRDDLGCSISLTKFEGERYEDE